MTRRLLWHATPLGALAVFSALVAAGPVQAQEAETLKRDLGKQIFFDAATTSFSRPLDLQVFEGDVVVIGAATLIAADRIAFDRKNSQVSASGHAIVLNGPSLFTGESLTYNLGSGDFEISQAKMLVNDQAEMEQVSRRVFGFTPAEIAFDQARSQRRATLVAAKDDLRHIAEDQARADKPISDALIDRYANLSEELRLVTEQTNPALARLSEERRGRFIRRREFWQSAQSSALRPRIQAFDSTATYLHLEGQRLTRVAGNDYAARNALFTPCRCERDEAPAWAFRADEAVAQIGGYADLHHAVMEIKGIPVLYLPEVRLPLKDQRQSGLLMPTAGYEVRSGNTFTLPVFFDLGPSSDATITTDVYENRGTRLGAEYRLQQRQFSGWDLHLEGIRDRLWLQDRAVRDELGGLYQSGLDQAFGKSSGKQPDDLDPGLSEKDYTRRYLRRADYWAQAAEKVGRGSDQTANYAAFKNDIDYYLATPRNAWRGSTGWRGTTYLAPRLSFVSNGEIVSDHRYSQELYVPDDFNDAIFGGPRAKAFATAKGQLHLDGKDFYLGLGNRYGDNFLAEESYLGQQVPMTVKLATRQLSLLPDRALVPVYGMASLEHLRIAEWRAVTSPQIVPTLGDGSWRRLRFSTVSPWVTDAVIQVNQFAEVESRSIEHFALDRSTSEMRSWRTGIEFRLPIDGKGELPTWLAADPCQEQGALPLARQAQLPGIVVKSQEKSTCAASRAADVKPFVHHLMDWRLRLSARPAVVKRGPYSEAAAGGLAYFTSDKPAIPDAVDADVADEERFSEHQRITLVTNQVWKIFERRWRQLDGTMPAEGLAREGEDPRARARRELLYSLERPVTSSAQIFDDSSQKYLINRYQRSDDYTLEPMHLHADIAYDLLDAKRRQQQEEQNRAIEAANALAAPAAQQAKIPLAEPWKDPHLGLDLNYAAWTLTAAAQYSIYLHIARSQSLSLITPTFFDTNASFGYTVTKEPIGDSFRRTTLRSVDLGTSLLRPLTTYISVWRRDVDNIPLNFTSSYKAALGWSYASPSQCWGWQMAREKDFGVESRDASYVFRVSVIFQGQQRPVPNLASGFVQQANNERKL